MVVVAMPYVLELALQLLYVALSLCAQESLHAYQAEIGET
jgi:hypothetical protein